MARLAEVPDADAKSRAMLERLGLTGAADKRLSQYSRGMLQRIGMCQALIHEPAYLFLDEPTSGLDPNGVLLVRDLITEQKARGAAVLLNSHQLAEIEKVCDRVLFLHHGLIERAETLRQTDRIAVAITMLPGFDAASVATIAGAAPRENVLVAIVENEQQIATLVKTLVDAGIGIIDVRRHTTDLESIFRGAA
jgi:ABC-2 type transport system ATP-binding protein